jgi:hypothetical protein
MVPMYAYALPGAHLVNYLYSMHEKDRMRIIKMKCPKLTSSIMKFRIDGERKPIVDTFKFTYQFGVFQGLTKILESEILKDKAD